MGPHTWGILVGDTVTEHSFGTRHKVAADGMPLACATCSCGWNSGIYYRATNLEYISRSYAMHAMNKMTSPGAPMAKTVEPWDYFPVVAHEVVNGVGWLALDLPPDADYSYVDKLPKILVFVTGDQCNSTSYGYCSYAKGA